MGKYRYAGRMETMRDTKIYMRALFDNMTDPNMKSFGGGAPARNVLPMKYMEKIAGVVLSDAGRGFEAFQYTAPFGLYDLREAVCEHLLKPTGIEAAPENVQIVSGGLETMALVCQLFIEPGDVILTEDPTFIHVSDTFKMFHAEIIACECDDEGIIPEDVERKIIQYNAKMVYTVPTFGNPTGRSLSVERRKALAELGGKYNVIILEDDPYRDVRYEGEALPAIYSFDDTGHVIMACSFSKIFAPGSRLGFAVASPELIYALRDVKIATNSQPPGISEVLCAEFFHRGYYEENLKEMCAQYKAGRDAMMETMDKFFPEGFKRTTPDGGYYIWVEFPKNVSTTELRAIAESEYKYSFLSGADWFPTTDPAEVDNTARFNFTTQPVEVIREGIETIGKIACELAAR